MKKLFGSFESSEITSKKIFCFCISFLLILIFSEFLPIHGEEKVYSGVIRLHVLANSDSDYDQNVKYAVRDKLIEQAANFFEDAEEPEDAAENITQNATKLLNFVNDTLVNLGAPYKASIKFGTEDYPTREYDGITYPSGSYLSLRILLGDGEGQNWWCVLFPPLCTDAAKAKESLSVSTEAKKTFTNTETKYVLRLKILEIFNKSKPVICDTLDNLEKDELEIEELEKEELEKEELEKEELEKEELEKEELEKQELGKEELEKEEDGLWFTTSSEEAEAEKPNELSASSDLVQEKIA